jgi:hypothetical protein
MQESLPSRIAAKVPSATKAEKSKIKICTKKIPPTRRVSKEEKK